MLFLLLAPTPPPVMLYGQAGQTVTLTVRLPAPSTGVLLNREAPNSIILKTPWGQWQTRLTGQPFPKRKSSLSDYFESVDPVTLQVNVPSRTPPGPVHAQLSLQLFTCNKKELLCQQKNLSYPMTIQVGQVSKIGKLNVPASVFRQSFNPGPDGS